MRRGVTIKDIANKLRISHTTVSRALREDSRISQGTRTKVRNLARKLGYSPNFAAAALSTGKTLSILFVVPYDLSKFPHLFHMEVFQGLAEEVSRYGYSVNVAFSQGKGKASQNALRLLTTARADGGVLLLVGTDENWVKEAIFPFPVVVVNQPVPESCADVVIAEDKHGAFVATKHLINMGHRAIAYISGPLAYYSPTQRLDGYRDALVKHGLSFDEDLVSIEVITKRGGYTAVKRLIKGNAHFTAVFCCSDIMALGALDALVEEKLKVPDNISLVGFDDDFFASLINPSLTTVRKPRKLMGREAGKIVLERISRTLEGNPVIRKVKTRLIVRSSSRPLDDDHPQILDLNA